MTRIEYRLDATPTGTRVKITHDGFASLESCKGHGDGWERVLGWLAEKIDALPEERARRGFPSGCSHADHADHAEVGVGVNPGTHPLGPEASPGPPREGPRRGPRVASTNRPSA